MLNERKKDLISQMTNIVLSYVEHFVTDFTVYDVPFITTLEDNKMDGYWLIRKSGTDLFLKSDFEDEFVLQLFRSCLDVNEKAFRILPEGTVIEIDIENLRTRFGR